MADPYLYLLRLAGTDLYKIGVATRPWSRLKQITAPGRVVEVVRVWPGLAGFERTLHRRWSHVRVRDADEDLPMSGRTEWFRLSESDVDQIKAECYCELLQVREQQRVRLRVKVNG